MSTLSMVTLHDGSRVSEKLFITTCKNIENAKKEAPIALFDLIEKCKNARYRSLPSLFGDSKSWLQGHALIDENENVYEDVKKIVLNSIDPSGAPLTLVHPLKKDITKL